MTTPLAHPLVNAYLRDLEMLLHGVEPVERAEVLGGVREHLDASLVPGASDAEVRAVLAEVGSPHAVADEAYAGRTPITVTPPPIRRPSPWLAHVACLLNGVGVAFLTLIVALDVRSSPETALVSGWAVVGLFFVIPWFCLMVLTSMTEVWGSPDKFRSILLFPVTLTALVVTAMVNVPVVGFLVVAVATWVLVLLVRATRAQAFGRR